MTAVKDKNTGARTREYLANERTFLAWIRTSIALMGFGFVIVKFTFFLREISMILEANTVNTNGYSAIVGVIMVALGVIIAVLAFLQYKKSERLLTSNSYTPSSKLSLFITLIILIGGLILISYLISMIKS